MADIETHIYLYQLTEAQDITKDIGFHVRKKEVDYYIKFSEIVKKIANKFLFNYIRNFETHKYGLKADRHNLLVINKNGINYFENLIKNFIKSFTKNLISHESNEKNFITVSSNGLERLTKQIDILDAIQFPRKEDTSLTINYKIEKAGLYYIILVSGAGHQVQGHWEYLFYNKTFDIYLDPNETNTPKVVIDSIRLNKKLEFNDSLDLPGLNTRWQLVDSLITIPSSSSGGIGGTFLTAMNFSTLLGKQVETITKNSVILIHLG